MLAAVVPEVSVAAAGGEVGGGAAELGVELCEGGVVGVHCVVVVVVAVVVVVVVVVGSLLWIFV